ncbi:hypothetical protein HMPREF0043_01303 [Actinobaculum sp. oral taxon 183 str. F0552]|nr:hypothetical protein HMPREF0043_01303 [Actinobaculum sp. oral taxon 183 str. F0552]
MIVKNYSSHIVIVFPITFIEECVKTIFYHGSMVPRRESSLCAQKIFSRNKYF